MDTKKDGFMKLLEMLADAAREKQEEEKNTTRVFVGKIPDELFEELTATIDEQKQALDFLKKRFDGECHEVIEEHLKVVKSKLEELTERYRNRTDELREKQEPERKEKWQLLYEYFEILNGWNRKFEIERETRVLYERKNKWGK